MYDQEPGIKRGNSIAHAIEVSMNVLNIVVTVIVAVETIVRFCSFVREWKPAHKKSIGFLKKGR